MKTIIQEKLTEIEREEGVRIVYACESGSRAWGFPSADSDYDVRFIYIRPQADYLRLDEPRDVIERPIVGDLDINGWDIRKTLKLFYKSNPTLMEWLLSPIVYREETSIAGKIRSLAHQFYQPGAAHAHYHSMARSTFKQEIRGESISLKKYFYVLRPIFAMQWIEQGLGVVPTEFQAMLATLPLNQSILDAIADLLEKKKAAGELGRAPRIEPISQYIEMELQSREANPPTLPKVANDIADLNRVLIESLHEAWA